jgi:transposase
MERRQICWAHLLRKFVSFAERDGPSAAFGRDLLNYTGILFEYWHDYKAGKLDRATFRAWMEPVRTQVEALLARAGRGGAPAPRLGLPQVPRAVSVENGR